MVSQSNGTMRSSLSIWSICLARSTKVSAAPIDLESLKHVSFEAGGKGRAAFCQAPAVDKEKRKVSDYSEYPLTTHGEMLYALVQSGISSYPHRAVSLQFFETVARYCDFFKVRKECIIPTLEAMVDTRSANYPFRCFV